MKAPFPFQQSEGAGEGANGMEVIVAELCDPELATLEAISTAVSGEIQGLTVSMDGVACDTAFARFMTQRGCPDWDMGLSGLEERGLVTVHRADGGTPVRALLTPSGKSALRSQRATGRKTDAVVDNLAPYDVAEQTWWGPPPKIKPAESVDFQVDIGLLVAVDVELVAALRALEPVSGADALLKVPVGPDTFYIGRLGCHTAVLSQCTTKGSSGPGGALISSHRMCRQWKPRALVMPGIAFGCDPTKTSIGDVLVSERVICYEVQRVGPGDEIVDRGEQPPPGTTLLNRFNNTVGWSFKRPDGKRVSRVLGPILSGDKLVDSNEFKQQLMLRFPTAIGGEMEGRGLWAGVDEFKVEWIVVKGICDWGVAKQKNHQELAATAAMSLVSYALGDSRALDGLGGRIVEVGGQPTGAGANGGVSLLVEVKATDIYLTISRNFRSTGADRRKAPIEATWVRAVCRIVNSGNLDTTLTEARLLLGGRDFAALAPRPAHLETRTATHGIDSRGSLDGCLTPSRTVRLQARDAQDVEIWFQGPAHDFELEELEAIDVTITEATGSTSLAHCTEPKIVGHR